MKKVMVLLIVALLTISLFGCGEGNSKSIEEQREEAIKDENTRYHDALSSIERHCNQMIESKNGLISVYKIQINILEREIKEVDGNAKYYNEKIEKTESKKRIEKDISKLNDEILYYKYDYPKEKEAEEEKTHNNNLKEIDKRYPKQTSNISTNTK